MANGARSDSIVRGFVHSSVFWLLVGLVVGLWLAAEMIYPALNLAPWLAFGRLRVVHTNGLIYGPTLGRIFAVGRRLTRLLLPAIIQPALTRSLVPYRTTLFSFSDDPEN